MSFDKNILEYLNSIGLENQESQVYLTALGLGLVPASIIAKKLNIPRSTARYSCEQLVRKGLMNFTQKANSKLFTAENPNKIYNILYTQREKLNYKTEKLGDMVHLMQKMCNSSGVLPKITFFEGEDGIERLSDIMLSEATDLYSFGAGDYMLNVNPKLVSKFRTKASKKLKNVYVIRSPKYKKIHENKDQKSFNTKYFEAIDENKVEIQITQDKMGIMFIDENGGTGLLIKHAEIIEAFQKIFIELWKKLD